MRKRTFFTLLGVTAILIAVTVIVRQGRAPEVQSERMRLLPEILDRVNEVAKIEVKAKDAQVVLVKKGEGWAVENRGGYPADFEKVKATVVTVAEMEILEPKTANRELYPRLGVEALDAEGSGSKLLTLSDAEGDTLASLIVGKPSSGRRSGTFVRPPNKAQALLVSGQLHLDADPLEWMDRLVLDIPAERVREVLIEVPRQPRIRIHKSDAKARDYALDALPKGEKLKSQIAINALATALQQLRFDDLSPRADFTLPEAHTVTTVRTYDGLQAVIKSAVVEERTRAILEIKYDAEAAAKAVAPEKAGAEEKKPGADEPQAKEDTAAKAAAPDAAKAAEPEQDAADKAKEERKPSVAEEVASLNAKVADWAYVLPSYKGELLAKPMKDLLAEKETGGTKAPASGAK